MNAKAILPLVAGGMIWYMTTMPGQHMKFSTDPIITEHTTEIPEGNDLEARAALLLDEIAEKLVARGHRASQVDSLLSDPSIAYDADVARWFIPRESSPSTGPSKSYEQRFEEYWMHPNIRDIRDGFLDKAQDLAPIALEVEERTGVPAKYVLAVYAHETQFGRVKWQHRLLDALVTIYGVSQEYDLSRRESFALRNLGGILDFANDRGEEVKYLNQYPASWAGAAGGAQILFENATELSAYTSFESMYFGDEESLHSIGEFLSHVPVRDWNIRNAGRAMMRYNRWRIYTDVNLLFGGYMDVQPDGTVVEGTPQDEVPMYLPLDMGLK